MLPVWSSATVNGFLLTGLPECTPGFQNAVFERTKNSGAEVLKKKGGAGWAVGIAIREVVHAVLLSKQVLLPVSSLIQGAYEIRDVCLSVPSVVSRRGVEKHVEIKLWPKEQMALQQSARALRETLAKVSVGEQIQS
jgi:L-lactate dehydrogenase